jgi:probable blue pigment (indigoidine) exporter
MSRRSFARRDVLALIGAATCWGLGTVISKRALEEIPPLTLLPIQLFSSLVVLAVLMGRSQKPLRDPTMPRLLGPLGLLNPGLAYALSLLGLVSISASLSVLLWAVEPLLIVGLAAVVLHERITPALVSFLAVAAAGIVLVIFEPATSGALTGVALTLAGVACCAGYTIVARRWLPSADSTAQVVLAQQGYGLAFAIVVVTAVALVGGGVEPSALTPLGLVAAIGSGALYYAAAYWLYLSALRALPASTAAASFFLIPIVGVMAGFLLLGERLDVRQWFGAALTLAAVLAILRPAAPKETRAPRSERAEDVG